MSTPVAPWQPILDTLTQLRAAWPARDWTWDHRFKCATSARPGDAATSAKTTLLGATPSEWDAAALRRHRKRLNDLRDEIVNEGDLTIEPGRTAPTAVGTDEVEPPLAEMSQTIASSRNRARASEQTRNQAALT